MNRLLSGWVLALFFFASTCQAQSAPNALDLLEKAWQAHVSVPPLRSLSFFVDGKTARDESKTDYEAFFRSIGVTDPDSLAKYLAFAQDDKKQDTSMRASLRQSWTRYSFDLVKNRWARLSFSPPLDSLKTVLSNGRYNDQNRVVKQQEYFRMAKNCPPMLISLLQQSDSVGYRGVYQLEGKPYACLGLRVGRESWVFSFDPQTYLLQRIATTTTDENPLPFGNETVFFTTDFQEYRSADGLTLPGSYTEMSSFDSFTTHRTTYHYTELAVNQPVDETVFGPPYRRIPRLVVTQTRLHPNLRLVNVQKFGTHNWLLANDGRQAVWFGEVAPAYDSLARAHFSSFRSVPQRTFINSSNRPDPFSLKPFLDADFQIAQLPPSPTLPETEIWKYVANGLELKKKADELSFQLDTIQVWRLEGLTLQALRYDKEYPRVLLYVPEIQTVFVNHWVGVEAKKQPLEREVKALLQRHAIRPKEFRLMNPPKDSSGVVPFDAWLNSFGETR